MLYYKIVYMVAFFVTKCFNNAVIWEENMSVRMEFYSLGGVSFTYKYTDEPIDENNYSIDISLDDDFLDEGEILSEEEFNRLFEEDVDVISEEMIKAA